MSQLTHDAADEDIDNFYENQTEEYEKIDQNEEHKSQTTYRAK